MFCSEQRPASTTKHTLLDSCISRAFSCFPWGSKIIIHYWNHRVFSICCTVAMVILGVHDFYVIIMTKMFYSNTTLTIITESNENYTKTCICNAKQTAFSLPLCSNLLFIVPCSYTIFPPQKTLFVSVWLWFCDCPQGSFGTNLGKIIVFFLNLSGTGLDNWSGWRKQNKTKQNSLMGTHRKWMGNNSEHFFFVQ